MKKNAATNIRQPANSRQDVDDPIVEFKITAPKAQQVALVGSFNGWDPKRTPLRNEGGGVWRVLLPLNSGRYEYRYIVDGQWCEDPSAKEFSTNPFGGHNSVLTVAGSQRQIVQTALAA